MKTSQGPQRGGEESGFDCVLQTSPQGLNISSISDFDQIRDPEIPIHPSLPLSILIRSNKWLKPFDALF